MVVMLCVIYSGSSVLFFLISVGLLLKCMCMFYSFGIRYLFLVLIWWVVFYWLCSCVFGFIVMMFLSWIIMFCLVSVLVCLMLIMVVLWISRLVCLVVDVDSGVIVRRMVRDNGWEWNMMDSILMGMVSVWVEGVVV